MIIAGGLWGFVELSEVARDATPHAFDTDILLAFREAGQPGRPDRPAMAGRGDARHHRLGSASVLVCITAIADRLSAA